MKTILNDLIQALSKTGNLREAYLYIEESLPMDKVDDVHNFVEWMIDEDIDPSKGNIDHYWERFENEVGLLKKNEKDQGPELPERFSDIIEEAP